MFKSVKKMKWQVGYNWCFCDVHFYFYFLIQAFNKNLLIKSINFRMKRNVNQKYKTHFLQQFKENIHIVLYYNVFFKVSHHSNTMEQQKSHRHSSNFILPISKYLLCRLVVLSWIFTNLEKIWYSKDSIAIVSWYLSYEVLKQPLPIAELKKYLCPKNYIKWCKKWPISCYF